MKFIQKEITGIQLLYTTFLKLAALNVIVGLIVRIVFLFNEFTQIAFTAGDWIKIFLLGAGNDIFMSGLIFVFMWLCLIFQSDGKYKKPWGYIIFGFIILCFGYVTLFNTIFDEYGSVVPQIVGGILLYKLISFGLRLFIPKIRKTWSITVYLIILFLYVISILLNAVSEYFFWAEFGVRYNFIAVDYLIYTNEVIGNIFESYPIIPLFSVLVLISAGVTYLLARGTKKHFDNRSASFTTKLCVSGLYFILIVVSAFLLKFNVKFQNSDNVYANELQANGIFKFYTAFMNSKLEYADFYVTLPENEALEILNAEYNSVGADNLQMIRDTLPEIHKNIVLISIESLSADFLERYGNTDAITPYIDNLIKDGLILDNVYATGNRTVRGLEALTLCIPPSSGESIVKQPNNDNLFSTGKILKEKGYTVQYLYGGDSYFDNMETFFSGNGYEIVDKKSLKKEEITFSNIWGVCDEDMYNKAIEVFNENAETGKPFFGHIMTVSNHRPFTYPAGKIDIPTTSKTRKGGIKYTDYALGKFIEKAQQQSWFDNTVFIITADHCASSAGKTEIPLDKYHIPALIYSPGFIAPGKEERLVSQIDIMPTVFGLLHFSYDSYFYGKNIYADDYKSKAFVATYQNLGYWEDNMLTILSPVRRIDQFTVIGSGDYKVDLVKIDTTDSTYTKKAITNYQMSGR